MATNEQMTANKINEAICLAVDTIIGTRLSELEYDKTIICTIESVIDADSGIYQVTDGVLSFQASSDKQPAYSVGKQVYVTIPKGDWSQKKIILSSYDPQEEKPNTYVSPGEQIAEFQSIKTEKNEQFGLIATTTIPEDENDSKVKTLLFEQNNLDVSNCDSIYIKGSFTSLFQNKDEVQGTYGLLVNAKYEDNAKKIANVFFMLSSKKDMFGNPYGYSFPAMQEVAYRLPDTMVKILELKCYFFQLGDFTGNYTDAQNENLFVRDVEVRFGVNMSLEEDKTVKLYTYDNLEYSANSLSRNVKVFWYNKTESNKYLGFNGIKNKGKAMGTLSIDAEDENMYQWVEWKIDTEEGVTEDLEVILFDDAQTISCSQSMTQTKVYATVWENGTSYEADPLVFINGDLKNNAMANLGVKIQIAHDKDSYDSYPLYGEDNRLLDSNNRYLERKVKMEWTYDKGEVLESWWYGAKIQWEIKQPSMLEPYDDETDYSSPVDIIEDNFGSVTTFSYRIKDTYSRNNINNTIKCTIITKQGYKQSVEKTFNFSSRGTTGTPFTLLVSLKDGCEGFTGPNKCKLNDFYGELYGSDGALIANANITLTSTLDSVNKGGYFTDDNILTWNVITASTKQPWLNGSTKLTTQYPVVYNKDGRYRGWTPERISYDSFGKIKTNSFYSQLKLFNKLDNTEVNNVKWVLYSEVNDPPEGYGFKIENNCLYVPPYFSSTYKGIKMILIAYTGDEFDEDNLSVIQYAQPIIIDQYSYEFDVLNNWDGTLLIDEDNNRILSAAAVFGIKRGTDNTFSGVVLGSIGNIKDGTVSNVETGIIGLDQGEQAFGFKNDGTAFIGKAGNGRIIFNGGEGVIASASWLRENGTIKPYLEEEVIGAKINLTDASFDFTGKNNQYLRFNNGQLNMSLSGLNIKLTDKDNMSVSGQIDATAKGITTEFRRTATYYATCATESGISLKTIVIQNFEAGFSNVANDNKDTINSLTYKDILKSGVMIAVTFTEEEKITENIEYNDDGTIKTITREGNNLALQIGEAGSPREIRLNNQSTGSSNPFGWAKGSVIYFIYKGNSNSGYWEVTDSGSYSRITQTADMIRSEVGSNNGQLFSKITQTATSITSDVVRRASYSGIGYGTGVDEHIIDVDFNLSSSEYDIAQNNFLEEGRIIAITFNYTRNEDDRWLSSMFKIHLLSGDKNTTLNDQPIDLGDDGIFWKQNDTINFIYTNGWFKPTTVSMSQIKQTADNISASVVSSKLDSSYSTQAFSWNLTSEGFYLNDSTTAGKNNFIFSCDPEGVKIGKTISITADTAEIKHQQSDKIGNTILLQFNEDEPKVQFGDYAYSKNYLYWTPDGSFDIRVQGNTNNGTPGELFYLDAGLDVVEMSTVRIGYYDDQIMWLSTQEGNTVTMTGIIFDDSGIGQLPYIADNISARLGIYYTSSYAKDPIFSMTLPDGANDGYRINYPLNWMILRNVEIVNPDGTVTTGTNIRVIGYDYL